MTLFVLSELAEMQQICTEGRRTGAEQGKKSATTIDGQYQACEQVKVISLPLENLFSSFRTQPDIQDRRPRGVQARAVVHHARSRLTDSRKSAGRCRRRGHEFIEVSLAIAASTFRDETGRLRRLTFDVTGNGRHDAVSVMDGSRIRHIELDADEDGRVDRWDFYREGRTLDKAGFSTRNNGVMDAQAFS